MTLKMPSDPFGAPGYFAPLGPLQEVSPLDGAYPLVDPSPNSDFIMDLEMDLDSSIEVLGDEVIDGARENEPTPLVSVKPLPPPVSTRAPRMPTILEEDEQEEDGDVTVTPSEAQKALLPPDTFACPPSTVSQLAGTADASQGTEFDSLETPRPGGEFHFAFYGCFSY